MPVLPDRHVSAILAFSSALRLLRLDMTTPPIEDLSYYLPSTGGAYQPDDDFCLAPVVLSWCRQEIRK